MNVLNMLRKCVAGLYSQTWPADPAERRRIKAYILGAGAGCAAHPDAIGKIRIEVEEIGPKIVSVAATSQARGEGEI